jgi:glycosyltransferase involved in cell wall biosynthesis
MKILVLYEELAWYFLNCLNVLCRDHKCEILVVRKKLNSIAPFNFKFVHPAIRIEDRDNFSNESLLQACSNFQPDFIFLAGWSQKKYLHVLRNLKVKKVIAGFDNQWEGSPRQLIGALYFKFVLKKYIHKAFVPGLKQKIFAKKIGFSEKDIIPDAYCCDFNFFNSIYYRSKATQSEFPKRFLYVGRYSKEKGIEGLWKAFIELKEELGGPWELWCLGKGEVVPVEHPAVKHFGFLQPEQMEQILNETGVFVLPSLFEPWGVVVHEHAAAGFPLICSNKVGSAEKFLEEGKNGFSYEAGNIQMLKEKLKIFMNISNEKFNLMSQKSVALASEVKPEIWADKLMNGFLL